MTNTPNTTQHNYTNPHDAAHADTLRTQMVSNTLHPQLCQPPCEHNCKTKKTCIVPNYVAYSPPHMHLPRAMRNATARQSHLLRSARCRQHIHNHILNQNHHDQSNANPHHIESHSISTQDPCPSLLKTLKCNHGCQDTKLTKHLDRYQTP